MFYSIIRCCAKLWCFIFPPLPPFLRYERDDIESRTRRSRTTEYQSNSGDYSPLYSQTESYSSRINSPSHDPSPLPFPSSVSKPTDSSSSSSCASNSVSKATVPSQSPNHYSYVKISSASTSSPDHVLSFRNSNATSLVPTLPSVTRSNVSTISHDPLPSRFKSNPISPISVQPHVCTSSSQSKSFSKVSIASPSSSSNDSESPRRDQMEAIERYEIPKHIKEMIKNDIVPPVLKKPVTPSTYGDYFSALLYIEDFYREKWSNYLLEDVTLELLSKESYFKDQSRNRNNTQNSNQNRNKNKKYSNIEKNEYFVTFEIDSVPESRPYLLSRDHVFLRPSGKGKDYEPFQGFIFRVAKTKTVLTEFEEKFHRQHKESNKYDVSFSFNRVCLKRAHRAVSAATTNPLLLQILFPKPNPNRYNTSNYLGPFPLIRRILNHRAPFPYLIEGPLSEIANEHLSSMGNMIEETILKIYKNIDESRVLICAPKNCTCDAFMSSIMEKVDPVELFRANAASRDIELVPDDVRETSLYKRECFACPPLHELQTFRIITSTFISTYRLFNAGLKSGHFTHIFLVDASSWVEPEIIVSLTDLVSEDTVLVITGSERDVPVWVRSDMGRRNGLRKSLFKRLLEREPYCYDDPMFVTRVTENVLNELV